MRQFFKLFTFYFMCMASAAGSFWMPIAWAKDNTVLVMGDSLSAGYGMSLEQAWPTLLQGKLHESRSKETDRKSVV